MSGDVSDRKRLISITAGCLRNDLIYISGHHDFFPRECFGEGSRSRGTGHPITLLVEGLEEPTETDIPTESRNGRPRYFFRKRSWVARFFRKHEIREGDVIAIERVDKFRYRVYPFDTKNVRAGAVIPDDWQPVPDGKFTCVDLFAGCGGFSAGLARAGFENLLAVEWDESCCRTFEANINHRILNCAIQEVETFPACDLLVGGPPCQGFSNLGEKVPDDPRRQLWRHFLRAVGDARPLVFVMENVPPLLKSAEYDEICLEARLLGYEVRGEVLNAAMYGVPQQRKRVIVIGSRIGSSPFPAPTHCDPRRHPTFDTRGLPPWKTVRDAIGDLPRIPNDENWHIGRRPTELSKRRYRCIPAGGNRWDLPSGLMPDCWKRKIKGGTDLFGRLWWDRPSVTIRTEFYKPEKGRYLHPQEHRPITHREAARLQGFEDDFRFIGTKIEVGRQIGNAVPPPLGHQIGCTVMREINRWRAKGIRLPDREMDVAGV